MASQENRHCASCIGTLSFPVVVVVIAKSAWTVASLSRDGMEELFLDWNSADGPSGRLE